jgi:hypothetical protein
MGKLTQTSPHDPRKAFLETHQEERALEEREEQIGQSVQEEVSFRALHFRVPQTQLYQEQVEQHACRQTCFHVSAFAENQDSRGQLEGREQQGEQGDVRHDHGGAQSAGAGEKRTSAKYLVNVIVQQPESDVDKTSKQIPRTEKQTR